MNIVPHKRPMTNIIPLFFIKKETGTRIKADKNNV
jgi:hypothetical protein